MELLDILRWIHGSFGFVVLGSGAVAIATKKGSRRHIRAGLVFFWSMVASVAFVTPSLIADDNLLLGGLGILVLYLVRGGRREIARRRSGEPPSRLDHAVVRFVGASSLGLLVLAAVILSRGRGGYGWVALGFGLLGAKLAWDDHVRFKDPEAARSRALESHLGYMGGAFIAATTAFSAVNFEASALPKWLVWLTPTIVGIPAITVATKRLRR